MAMLAEKAVKTEVRPPRLERVAPALSLATGDEKAAPSPALALRGQLESLVHRQRSLFRLNSAGLFLAGLLSCWLIGLGLYASL
jgi:hypothetical protein